MRERDGFQLFETPTQFHKSSLGMKRPKIVEAKNESFQIKLSLYDYALYHIWVISYLQYTFRQQKVIMTVGSKIKGI